MGKAKRVIAFSVAGIALGYLGLSAYLWYYDGQRVSQPDFALSENKSAESDKLLVMFREKGCDYCHTASAELPFYASLPVAKQLMEYDVQLGYKSFDLHAVNAALINGTPVSDSDLNKLDWVMSHETMPPSRYTALHWAGKISQQERKDILAWIAAQRERRNTDAAGTRRNEPVRPLPRSIDADPRKAELGFRLYHDTRLSGDNTLSCASCHGLDIGGVDGKKTSVGVAGAIGPINAPTVYNSGFNISQFWDGRAADLQEQAGGPPMNPIEMASQSWEEIIVKLSQDSELSQDFRAVYPQGFTGETITDAIAEFEKTLITPDAPFDNWLRGDDGALTAQEQHGYELFKENKCATCHAGVILGGISYEPLGLKQDYEFGVITDADTGRMNVTNDLRDKFRQKVPMLRNISHTGPYFHRGDVSTLDEAVKLMLKYQVGKELPQRDVDDIVAFLNSLNGVYTPYSQAKR